MKLLRQFQIKSSGSYLNQISLYQNQGEYELWFSCKTEMINNSMAKNFESDVAQVNDFLDVARNAPGKMPCKFTFEPKKDTDGLHLKFKGNLFTALMFLKEIDLESTAPAINYVIEILKDRDEAEFNNAFADSTSSTRKSANNRKHDRTNSGPQENFDENENSPLLPKPVLAK